MLLKKFNTKSFVGHLKLIQEIHYTKKGTFNAAPDTVYEVVKNTHKYSDFIPWCNKSSITKHISSS